MDYVRNGWYMAAWSSDIASETMLARKLLDEPIIFYRKKDGSPVALQDRCPHRFVPLHMGKVKDDIVECCYHGLQFDCSGKCVKNPHGDGKIPAAAKVRSYSVVDKHGISWIWMGEKPHDVSLIPDYSMLDADAPFRRSHGRIMIEANYELMGENLLDLSHITFLHEGILGSPEMVTAQTVVQQEGNRLHCNRWTPNVSVPGAFDMLFRRDGKPVDMWLNMRWDPPSNYLLDVGVHAPGETRDQGAWYYGVHILTPETSRTTHYHFAAARPASAAELDPEINAKLAEFRRIAFEEQDKPILDAQQAALGDSDFWSLKPVLLSVDAGPIRMRRMLEQLVKKERAEPAAA